jgi:hypothetical protein
MSELGERRWAVASERGREASGLTYAEAVELERGLKAERIGGLCVVTDEAARNLPGAQRGGAEDKEEPAGAGRRRPSGGTRADAK